MPRRRIGLPHRAPATGLMSVGEDEHRDDDQGIVKEPVSRSALNRTHREALDEPAEKDVVEHGHGHRDDDRRSHK
jgi:hypothetical protein